MLDQSMKNKFEINTFQPKDFEALFSMAKKLWKDFQENELIELLEGAVEMEKVSIYIAKNNSNAIGFAIFSIRSDYVEGAVKSPTGYLEGVFVEEAYRKSGLARRFMVLGEKWCESKNCKQIGSDTWLDNAASREFHKKLGFKEEEELVHFIKDIE